MVRALSAFTARFLRFLQRRYFTRHGFFGDYLSWNEAASTTRGYDDPAIFAKSIQAAEAVMRGEACFERDSVLFHSPTYSWPLLAAVGHAAAGCDGPLHVADFGGGPGSTFFQHRRLLPEGVVWSIVEQPAYVDWGRGLPQGPLRFFASLAELNREARPRIVVLSSVLQYLENPNDLIGELLAVRPNFLLLDLVLCQDRDVDRICVQRVPPEIVASSYPVWCFAWSKLLKRFSADYELMADFESYVGNPSYLDRRERAYYRGAFFRLRGGGASADRSPVS